MHSNLSVPVALIAAGHRYVLEYITCCKGTCCRDYQQAQPFQTFNGVYHSSCMHSYCPCKYMDYEATISDRKAAPITAWTAWTLAFRKYNAKVKVSLYQGSQA